MLNYEEQAQVLGKNPTKFYYKFGDYKYIDTPKDRVLSGIRELDIQTKGFELGFVTIWTGFTNSGKTTMLTMIAKKSIEQGERIFFFNGEQTKDDFKNNLYKQSVTKKDIVSKQFKNSCVFENFVSPNKIQELENYYSQKIFIYNNEMPRNIDTLLYTMEELRRTEKIRVFFLDNFMQIDLKTENIYHEQSEIMEKLRTFAINKKVHIHLVAHPRKTERFQIRLSLYDIAGSSNLVNRAYNIIAVMRTDNIDKSSKEYEKLKNDLYKEGYDIEKSDAVLDVLKTKGERCGVIAMSFNKETKTYCQLEALKSEEKEKIKWKKGEQEECPF